ncbi:MAG: hypothetical protein H8E98_01160 [Bacteroidetes bacterium]|nr:hypothetical protein [Bacteroidota bacterium]
MSELKQAHELKNIIIVLNAFNCDFKNAYTIHDIKSVTTLNIAKIRACLSHLWAYGVINRNIQQERGTNPKKKKVSVYYLNNDLTNEEIVSNFVAMFSNVF